LRSANGNPELSWYFRRTAVMTRNAIAPLLLLPACLTLAGCVYESEISGPLRTESRSIDIGAAESVRVEVKMGAGDLNIAGGARKLMESEFRYNRPAWKPEVRYEVSGMRGTLTVRQPSRGGFHGGSNTKNEWNLKLSDDARIELDVGIGAGQGHLDLGSLSLRALDVEIGAGELRLDLRGNPKRSYDVRIRGGVGDANVYLPVKAGVIANAQGGIGSISARGMEKRGGSYVNSAYDKSDIAIHLDIKGGIGSITLICE
jgi:N-terminal domain of toast_rack, DUF2154